MKHSIAQGMLRQPDQIWFRKHLVPASNCLWGYFNCGLTVHQIDDRLCILKGFDMWVGDSARHLRCAVKVADRARPRALIELFDWLDPKEIWLIQLQHKLTSNSRICSLQLRWMGLGMDGFTYPSHWELCMERKRGRFEF